MNDVNNRIFREFTEFFDNVEKSASEISVTMAWMMRNATCSSSFDGTAISFSTTA